MASDFAITGPEDGEPIIFLHGFPESHRTWRHQIRHFSDRYRCIAPDQRGYCGSSKPEGVERYRIDKLVGDVFALADALGIDRFTLVAHDWGGAAGWAAALTDQRRVKRLIIANAPHPYTYQRAIYEDMDQRAASQYVTAFRGDGFERYVAEKGWDAYYKDNFEDHVDAAKMGEGERAIYLRNWQQPGAFTAMLNWYRASPITVPGMDENPPRPAFLDRPFPKLTMPVLVIWAMDDKALRPSLLEGLNELIDDYTLMPIPGCGHFVTWEAPEAVIEAMEDWLAER